ncbi:hypothetical protein [Alicyclobacillus sendaiensis]|uniref:hypothetical protein n=1 Tax=Alicyclobacillus sendaiensis TaxID=192387 RepID=UPI0007858083|nr:hypothetical protein [Alicyclobacillus sendaiensis]
MSQRDLRVQPVDVRTRDEIEDFARVWNDLVGNLRALIVEEVADATKTIVAEADHMSRDMAVVVELAQQAARESESVVAASQQQASSMQEIASTAASLSARAQDLQSLIGRFLV